MAMKEVYWHGNHGGVAAPDADTGKWDHDDNWRLCSDGSASIKPADEDRVHVDNRAYYNETDERYQDIKLNMAAAQTLTPNLALFHVASSYDGHIGLVGEYLEINVSFGAEPPDAQLIWEGTGVGYIMLSLGAAASSKCDLLIMNAVGAYLYMKGFDNDAGHVAELTKAIVYAGNLNLGTVADADTIAPLEVICNGVGAVVNIGTGCQRLLAATSETNFLVLAGIVTSDSPIGNCDGYGGTFNWGTADATATAGTDLTGLLTLWPNFTFNWKAHDTAATILKQFKAYGGTLDASLATNADVSKQIGTGAGEISEMWGAAAVDLNNGLGNIAFGAGSKIAYYGGVLSPSFSEEITW